MFTKFNRIRTRFLRKNIVTYIAFCSKFDERFSTIPKCTRNRRTISFVICSVAENLLQTLPYVCTYVFCQSYCVAGWKLGAWHIFLQLLLSNATCRDKSLKDRFSKDERKEKSIISKDHFIYSIPILLRRGNWTLSPMLSQSWLSSK